MALKFQNPNSNFRVETKVDNGLLFFWVLSGSQTIDTVVPIQVGTGATELKLSPGNYQFQWQVTSLGANTIFSVTVAANQETNIIHNIVNKKLTGPIDFFGKAFVII